MKITLLVVNYQSAQLTRTAIDSARAATDSAIEVVVIDNSTSPDEAERLARIETAHLIISETNLGYGAAVNRALDVCSGEVIIVSNPDVVFSSGSIEHLIEPMENDDVALTGPSFYWDAAMEWHLPPPEPMTFTSQLLRNLSRRSRLLSTRRARRLLDRRLVWWSASVPTEARVLSGAVMAFRAADLERFHFDERYPLYFEEVDLMRRLRRAGRQLIYCPAARVRHIWAQSSSRNPEASFMFEISRRAYQRRWFSRFGDAALEISRSERAPRCEGRVIDGTRIELPVSGSYLVELADDRDFVMAAGRFTDGGMIDLPVETLRNSPLTTFCCRVIDLTTRQTIHTSTLQV